MGTAFPTSVGTPLIHKMSTTLCAEIRAFPVDENWSAYFTSFNLAGTHFAFGTSPLYEMGSAVWTWVGAGYPATPTKVKALAVPITKRNPDFLGIENSGKKSLLWDWSDDPQWLVDFLLKDDIFLYRFFTIRRSHSFSKSLPTCFSISDYWIYIRNVSVSTFFLTF